MCFRNNFDMMLSKNTLETRTDQKTLMPRNLVVMIAQLEFKETFPTFRVIHWDDSTGKGHGTMLQMIKFQKSNGVKYKYNNSITQFVFVFFIFLFFINKPDHILLL